MTIDLMITAVAIVLIVAVAGALVSTMGNIEDDDNE